MALKKRVVLTSIRLGRYNKTAISSRARRLQRLSEERDLMVSRGGYSYIIIVRGESNVQK